MSIDKLNKQADHIADLKMAAVSKEAETAKIAKKALEYNQELQEASLESVESKGDLKANLSSMEEKLKSKAALIVTKGMHGQVTNIDLNFDHEQIKEYVSKAQNKRVDELRNEVLVLKDQESKLAKAIIENDTKHKQLSSEASVNKTEALNKKEKEILRLKGEQEAIQGEMSIEIIKLENRIQDMVKVAENAHTKYSRDTQEIRDAYASERRKIRMEKEEAILDITESNEVVIRELKFKINELEVAAKAIRDFRPLEGVRGYIKRANAYLDKVFSVKRTTSLA